MNMSVSKEKLLALLHSKSSNPNKLSEHIDENVKNLIGELNINDIADFVNDHAI